MNNDYVRAALYLLALLLGVGALVGSLVMLVASCPELFLGFWIVAILVVAYSFVLMAIKDGVF